MFQNLHHTLAELGTEPLEDQMRIGFRDGATGGVGDVGSEDDVVEREGGGGPVRQMRDRHRGGCAAVFVEKDNV